MTKAEAAAKGVAVAPPPKKAAEGNDRRAADAGEAGLREEAGRSDASAEVAERRAFLVRHVGAGGWLHRAERCTARCGRSARCGSCSRTCCASRRAGSRSASPTRSPPGQVEEKFKAQFGVWIVNTEVQRPAGDLRPEERLHAPGLHAELARSGAEIQMPLPRQRFLQGRHQFRRSRPASAGTLRDPHRQRRPDRSRQEQHVPGGNGAVERPGQLYPGVSERCRSRIQGSGNDQRQAPHQFDSIFYLTRPH